MLGLPQPTEVRRSLPKAQLYRQFDWKPSQRESFDGEVSRLDFVNWISPRTLPGIAVGTEVKEIYVVEVALKTRDFDSKNIAFLGKSIPQRIVYVLRYGDEVMLAVYYTRLFLTTWQPAEDVCQQLNGLNLDNVWENIVRSIVGTSLSDVSKRETQDYGPNNCQNTLDSKHAEGMSLQEQIIAADERAKIERQIAALERQMFSTKQPRRKRELFEQIQKLKHNYEDLR